MAIVTIDLLENSLTQDQKRDLIARVTEAVVAVEGEALRPLSIVRIHEIAAGELALGGKPMTSDDLHEIAAAQHFLMSKGN